MDDTPSTAQRIATGAAVGLFAGLIAAFAMDRFQALTQPAADSSAEPATQKAADRVAIFTTGSPVSKEGKPMAGQAVHYGVGALLGLGYGIAAEFEPRVTAGLGTAFATGTWAALDEAIVPAAGFGNPPWKTAAATHAYGWMSHIIFGVSAEITRRLARHAFGK